MGFYTIQTLYMMLAYLQSRGLSKKPNGNGLACDLKHLNIALYSLLSKCVV